jgi:uncharacterized protein YaiE (UPF0345 family)
MVMVPLFERLSSCRLHFVSSGFHLRLSGSIPWQQLQSHNLFNVAKEIFYGLAHEKNVADVTDFASNPFGRLSQN